MKSLIISTSDIGGGAAIAAYRLHDGLRQIGQESRMLVRQKLSIDVDVAVVPGDEAERKATLATLSEDLRLNARTDLSSTYFTLPWPGEYVASHPLVESAAIINLHWIGQFLSPESVRQLLLQGKPVILTLHDQRAFTGGCHYTAGCDGFVDSCARCPQLRPAFHGISSSTLALSRACLEGVPAPVIVAPSRWLAHEARRSALFSQFRIECIPYGLDLDVFKAGDRHAARTHFGLPQEAIVLLFGAQNLAERRKGFDLIQAALEQLLEDSAIARLVEEKKVVFAAYGQNADALRATRLPLVLLGEQATPGAMAKLLSASNLFICPSREDNLPNTVMEAMACGVPVLGTDVGGIPDMVTQGEHGMLVPPNDPAALSRALAHIISRPAVLATWSIQARAKCERQYALRHQAQAYSQLHEELLMETSHHKVGTVLPAVEEATRDLQDACARAADQLREERTERLRQPPPTESASHSKQQSPKEALKRVETSLKSSRRNPFWFIFPQNLALKRERDRLRQEVQVLNEQKAKKQRPEPSASVPKPALAPATLSVEGHAVQGATAILTVGELNDRHGTGVLLNRIFKESPNYIHLRSLNVYGGETGGALRICLPAGSARTTDIDALLQGSTIERILSVPYYLSDIENSLALAGATGAPMCVWIMDNNLGDGPQQISTESMQGLLNRAKLRLGISPEMCELYEAQFGHRFHFAPPVVEAKLGQNALLHLPADSFLPPKGVLLGNFWSGRWMRKLAATVTEAKVPLVAFGHKSAQLLKYQFLDPQVELRGFVSEPELIAGLRQHPFAIVPTGTLDEDDDLPEVARCSLPSRTLYLSAVGNLPVIVVGHDDTGVARFVRRHGLGLVVPYNAKQLRRAVDSICRPEQQLQFRRRAAELAPAFACDDMEVWLGKSLDTGWPYDERWTNFASSR